MRYADLKRPLLEMNVANSEEAAHILAGFVDRVLGERNAELPDALYQLFMKRAMKAAVNDETLNYITRTAIRGDNMPDEVPEWMARALQRGEAVYQIFFKDRLTHLLPHIIDWLLVDPRAANALRAAPDATYFDALYAAADKYFQQQSQKVVAGSSVEAEPGRDVVMTFRQIDGAEMTPWLESNLAPNAHGEVISFWARLTGKEALDREGKLMQHCVGSYADRVVNGRVVIYSLRDMKNMPHATIEVRKMPHDTVGPPRLELNQVKGKQNKPPVPKYIPFVKPFLTAMKIVPGSGGERDLEPIGVLHRDGKYGSYQEIAEKVGDFPNGDGLYTLGPQPAVGSFARNVSYQEYRYFTAKGDQAATMSINVANNQLTRVTPDNGLPEAVIANVADFLNAKHTISGGDVASFHNKSGLYYNHFTKRWGDLDAVSDEIGRKGRARIYGMTGHTGTEVLYVCDEQRPDLLLITTNKNEMPLSGVAIKDIVRRHGEPDHEDYVDFRELSAEQSALIASVFNEHHMKFEGFEYKAGRTVPTSEQLEFAGLYYSGDQLGPLSKVAQADMQVNAYKGYRLDIEKGERYLFTKSEYEPALLEVRMTGKRITAINSQRKDDPEIAEISAILMQLVADKQIPFEAQDKGIKETLRSWGVVFVPARDAYVSAFDSKNVLLDNDTGRITKVLRQIYFYGPDGSFLTSQDMGQARHNETIRWPVVPFPQNHRVRILKLISQLCETGMERNEAGRAKQQVAVAVSGFDNDTIVDLGFIQRDHKLIDARVILDKKLKIPGAAVHIKLGANRSTYTAERHGEKVEVIMDNSNSTATVEFTPGAADMVRPLMKQLGAEVQVKNLLTFGLKLQNGKLAPRTEKDVFLNQFAKGAVDVGGGYRWKSANAAAAQNNFIATGWIGPPSDPYDGFIRIDQKQNYDAPSVRIRRRPQDGDPPRDAAYKLALKFMKNYHELIEPMVDMEDEWVGA